MLLGSGLNGTAICCQQCNVSFVFSLSDKIAPVLNRSDKIKIRYSKKNIYKDKINFRQDKDKFALYLYLFFLR
jgi:hypothetical protein